MDGQGNLARSPIGHVWVGKKVVVPDVDEELGLPGGIRLVMIVSVASVVRALGTRGLAGGFARRGGGRPAGSSGP